MSSPKPAPITGHAASVPLPAGAAELYSATSYRSIVEQMGAGVGALSAERLLLYANPRLGELLDRPWQTLPGRPLAELIPASQRACLDRLCRVSPGRTERAELELLPDEAGEPVRVLAAVTGLRGDGTGTHCLTLTDLSGIQSPGRTMASDAQRHRLLEEAGSAFVVETDRQRRLCWVSPAVHAVLGWMPQELIGACLTDLLHPQETLENELPSGWCQRLLRLRARDGSDRWMRLLCWPLQGEGRNPHHWIIGFQDVSELVAQQRARAIDQARLAAVLLAAPAPGPQIVGDPLCQPDGAVQDVVGSAAIAAQVGDGLGASRGGGGARTSAPLPPQRLQPIAGLVSRAELLEQLWRLHPPAHRRTKPLGLALCHLRNLREIHEAQGSEIADRVLRTIEQRLRKLLGHATIVARVNVDQLLVVFAGMDNHAQVEATAESMRVVVGLPLQIPDAALRISLWVDPTLEQPGELVENLISSAMRQARVAKPFHPTPVANH
jgi:diguanylate cyclase (GGDEF)-like protein/PAS domain S-box-containing protein